MDFDPENIELSYTDKSERVALPKRPSKALAEVIGILAGDGYVGHLGKGEDHMISIAGNLNDELLYLEYVKNLFELLFNFKMKLILRKDINTAYLMKRSKGILSFLHYIGYEKNGGIVKVPKWIWENEDYIKYFIRGVFDTDGAICLKKNHGKYRFYPVVNITSKDGILIRVIANWVKHKNIPYYISNENYLDKRTNKSYAKLKLQVSGYKNVRKWIELIGTSNPKQKLKMGQGGFEPPIVEGQISS